MGVNQIALALVVNNALFFVQQFVLILVKVHVLMAVMILAKTRVRQIAQQNKPIPVQMLVQIAQRVVQQAAQVVLAIVPV